MAGFGGSEGRFELPRVVSGAKVAATFELGAIELSVDPGPEPEAGEEALKGLMAVGAVREERSPPVVETLLGMAESDWLSIFIVNPMSSSSSPLSCPYPSSRARLALPSFPPAPLGSPAPPRPALASPMGPCGSYSSALDP